jgi:hypothetical protein
LKAHAIQQFLDDADLGREEMVLLEEHLRRSLKGAEKECLVLVIAGTYASAIKRATGSYADSLTQVCLSRRRRAILSERTRMSICGEAIRFADDLNTPEFHSSWAENTQAPTFPLGTAPFEERERTLFWERMRIYRSDWSHEADRRITLRFLLFGGRAAPVHSNPFQREVARLMSSMLYAADREICLEMDHQNERALSEIRRIPFPVPKIFERNGIRLWAEPFEKKRIKLIQYIHELLSKIRKKFGLRRSDPKPNRPPFSKVALLDTNKSSLPASDPK